VTCCFPKSVRLRTRRQYQHVGRNFSRRVGCWIVVECVPVKDAETRLGITVSRHYGNAVKRNRFKRIVREAFRLCRHQLPKGFDLNIKPRSPSSDPTSADILTELMRLMK